MTDPLTDWIPPLRTLPYQRLAMAWARVGRQHADVGMTDPDRITRQLIHRSVLVSPLLRAGRSILDVGSGVGIPGLPLALAAPARPVWLVEPRTRPVALIRWILNKLPPLHVFLDPVRLESVPFYKRPPLQAVTRAALDWDQLREALPADTDPLIRWAGERVAPPPAQPDRTALRITVRHESLSQTFYWWGSRRLFHVKQSLWDATESIRYESPSPPEPE